MLAAESLSLLGNGVAERAFANEPFLRRLAKVARLEPGASVLQLAAGAGNLGLLLAQTLRCKVTVVDTDAEHLASIAKASKDLSLGSKLETRQASVAELDGPEGAYRVVIAMGSLEMAFEPGAEKLRKLLVQDGRICRVHPVRVGFGGAPADWLKAWEAKLGEPLPSPAELLRSLERAGFEPESVESLSDAELDGVLRSLSPEASERLLFPNSTVVPRASYAMAIGRRKDPNEKPPASSDRG